MTLYHFTSPLHVGGIQQSGIRLGQVLVSFPWHGVPRLRAGFQWLTTNPDPVQSWTEGSTLPYDRTAFRIRIHIPRQQRGRVLVWLDVCGQMCDDEAVRTLNAFGDPENWRLFRGDVPPSWFECVEDMRSLKARLSA